MSNFRDTRIDGTFGESITDFPLLRVRPETIDWESGCEGNFELIASEHADVTDTPRNGRAMIDPCFEPSPSVQPSPTGAAPPVFARMNRSELIPIEDSTLTARAWARLSIRCDRVKLRVPVEAVLRDHDDNDRHCELRT